MDWKMVLEKLASRKLLAMLIGVVASFAGSYGISIPPEVQSHLLEIIMVYMASQAGVDMVAAFKAPAVDVVAETKAAAKSKKYIKKGGK